MLLYCFYKELVKLMNKYYYSFVYRVIGVSILLITSDFLFYIVEHRSAMAQNWRSILFIIAMSIGINLLNQKVLLTILLSFFSIIQLIQLCHLKYFGTLLSPFALYLMTNQIYDVMDEAVSLFLSYGYIIPVATLPFLAIYKLCSNACDFRKIRYSKYIPMLGICIILITIRPWVPCGKSSSIPNEIKFTLENSTRAFFSYLAFFAKKSKLQNYKPYIIERIKLADEKPITIVYIIGESTNAEHMSLFDYKINTTPLLNKLAQSDNFYYTVGIAGSVATLSSCKFICNAIREPNNLLQASLETTNIFKLAKDSGFKTFYISAQLDDLLACIRGVQNIDVLITKEQYPSQFSQKKDNFLLELLDQQKFVGKNFVVIHQRCIHSPYLKALPHGYWKSNIERYTHDKNPIINQYDDAMRYVDFVIASLFNKFNKISRFYIFWASDHNELLGECKGLYGHGHLIPRGAQIPIMIQSNDAQFMQSIKKVFAPTHYDICEAISNLLGYKITNPNQEEGIYYINGVGHSGQYGYIRLKKDYENKKIEYSDVLFDR